MMKKFTITGLLVCAAITTASAQSTYLRAGTGYAFAAASGSYSQYSNNSSGETEKLVHFSYGKGINSQIAIGRMFTEHFGIELGIGYLKGLKTEFNDTDVYNGETETYTTEHRANMFSLLPAVVLRGGGERVVPYGRFGVIAGSVKGITTYESGYVSETYKHEIEETGGITFGFTAALGVQIPVSEKFSLFAEGNLMQLAWAPKEGKVTKASYNGENVLDLLDDEEKEVKYVDEITYDYSSGGNIENKELRAKRPMSNAGLSIGVQFNF